MGKIWTNSRRHLVILYTRYTTRKNFQQYLLPEEISKVHTTFQETDSHDVPVQHPRENVGKRHSR